VILRREIFDCQPELSEQFFHRYATFASRLRGLAIEYAQAVFLGDRLVIGGSGRDGLLDSRHYSINR